VYTWFVQKIRKFVNGKYFGAACVAFVATIYVAGLATEAVSHVAYDAITDAFYEAEDLAAPAELESLEFEPFGYDLFPYYGNQCLETDLFMYGDFYVDCFQDVDVVFSTETIWEFEALGAYFMFVNADITVIPSYTCVTL